MEKGEQFLGNKYGNLNTSKEVVRAVAASEEIVPQKKDAQIGAYMNRLESITEHERGKDLLESMIEKDFVLDTKDEALMLKLAHALYNSEKQVAINRGQTNEIQNLEVNDNELLHRYKDAIIEKAKIQKESLRPWLNYIKANDAEYPMAFRYFVLRSLKNMGQFSRDDMTYGSRTENTIAPFPEMNAEALAFVYKSLSKQLEIENLPKDTTESSQRANAKKEYIDSVGLNPEKKDELEEEFAKRLEGKDFAKLYAFAQVEAAGSMSRESLKGEWVKYPQGSDYHKLEESLKGKGTGWCTATGSAQGQIDQGDFYTYYTLNKAGLPTEPRIAIRMSGNQVAEIRGVNPRQELEPELVDIAKEKYKDLPGAEKYEKADADMRMMTSIYNKVFKTNKETGEKIYQNSPLSKEELLFIYEINASIESFGYDKDPRIKEVREKRVPLEDAPIIFECSPTQIASNANEIHPDTKAYIGGLENGIFDKLKNLEHIYTNFPEGKIQQIELESGIEYPKSTKEWVNAFETKNIAMESGTEQMLDIMEKTELAEDQKFVMLTVESLGFPDGAEYQSICEKAQSLGLELCTQDDGPKIQLSYNTQLNGTYFRTAMKSINSGGSLRLWDVPRDDDGKRELLWSHGRADLEWGSALKFLFRLCK